MAYILAIISAAAYGLNIFFIQMGMESGEASGKQVLLINLIAGTLSLFLFSLVYIFLFNPQIVSFHGLIFFVASGLFGPFLGRIFNITSIKNIGGSRTSILRMSENLITIILAIIILREKITLISLIGVLILVSGLLISIYENESYKRNLEKFGLIEIEQKTVSERKIFRLVFVFAASFFFAMGKIFNRIGLDYLPFPLIGAFISTLTALCTNSIFVLTSRAEPFRKKISKKVMLFFALSGFSSSAGLVTILIAMNLGGLVSLVTAIRNSSTLFTLLFIIIFLRKVERLNLLVLLSFVVVITGVMIIVLN